MLLSCHQINKLKNSKNALKNWSKEQFSKTDTKTNEIVKELDSLKQQLPSPDRKAQIEAIECDLDELVLREKIIWKQKSREKWVQESDENIKLMRANDITRITNHLLHIKFSGPLPLFWPDPSIPANSENLIPQVIIEQENLSLTQIPTAEEIKRILFNVWHQSPRPGWQAGNFLQERRGKQ